MEETNLDTALSEDFYHKNFRVITRYTQLSDLLNRQDTTQYHYIDHGNSHYLRDRTDTTLPPAIVVQHINYSILISRNLVVIMKHMYCYQRDEKF